MPKIKTRSTTKKRFRVTRNGKLMHASAFKRKKLEKKSAKRKRGFALAAPANSADVTRVRRALGV
jgi:large subunit ribosomal protein L35